MNSRARATAISSSPSARRSRTELRPFKASRQGFSRTKVILTEYSKRARKTLPLPQAERFRKSIKSRVLSVLMFGYIQPDAPYLFKKDEKLYQALYCGLCKSIGKGCGQCARTALTYDMAFMSALVHNIKQEDVIIKKVRCAIHWLKRRPVALVDDTTVLMGCVNTALAYYKLCDDKADGDRKGIFRHLYKRG